MNLGIACPKKTRKQIEYHYGNNGINVVCIIQVGLHTAAVFVITARIWRG